MGSRLASDRRLAIARARRCLFRDANGVAGRIAVAMCGPARRPYSPSPCASRRPRGFVGFPARGPTARPPLTNGVHFAARRSALDVRRDHVRPARQPRRRLLVPLGLRAEHRLRRRVRSEVRDRRRRHDLRDDVHRPAGQPRRRLQRSRPRPPSCRPARRTGSPTSGSTRSTSARPATSGSPPPRAARRTTSIARPTTARRSRRAACCRRRSGGRASRSRRRTRRASTSRGYQVAARRPRTSMRTDNDGAAAGRRRRSPNVQYGSTPIVLVAAVDPNERRRRAI